MHEVLKEGITPDLAEPGMKVLDTVQMGDLVASKIKSL